MREVTRSVNLAAKLIPGMYKTQKAGCTWVTPALFGRETASPGNRQWWEQERERGFLNKVGRKSRLRTVDL